MMTFTPVQKVSAYEAIVEQIEGAIETGELRPGDRLPGERRLMMDFSVSRATVREALRVLQAMGLVESRPGDPRGPIIATFSPRLLEKSLAQISRHGGSSRIELLQFRLFLEGSSAFLAAQRRTPEQLAKIEDAYGALRTAVLDGELGLYPSRVRRFHDTIREAAANRLLAACGGAISDIMSDVMADRISSEPAPTVLLERGIVDGATALERIRDRDAAGAREAQIGGIFRFYESALDEAEREALRGVA
jgi:DNA-binding FadR family transcriptional regulator